MHARILAFAVALLLGPVAAAAGTVTVFAAASLKTALDEIAAGWQAETGNTVILAYEASSTLARQIEAGAPAELFISASTDWMDELAGKGKLQAGTRRDLIGNQLVLVASNAAAPAVDLTDPAALPAALAGGHLAMALVDSVPAGVYGKQALTNLGLWPAVEPRVVQSANVRAALALVATGEAPYGIVYTTDAIAEPRVHVVGTFPAGSHAAILYPAAAIAGASAEARAFLDHLSADAAHAIFAARGFTFP